jgi:hypothetical protein
MFIHIPKTGGTGIENLAIFDAQREATGEHVGGHATALEFRERYPVEFETYFKFAFVRNPYDRLVSAFFHFRKGGAGRADRELGERFLGQYDGDFGDFCRGFLHEGNLNEIVHFRRQVDFLCDQNGEIIVDAVGRLETLSEDFARVCATIGFPYELRRTFRGNRRDYARYYDEESKRIVEEVYRQDLETFDYSFDNDLWRAIRKDAEQLALRPAKGLARMFRTVMRRN